MTQEEFDHLREDSLIRNLATDDTYVIVTRRLVYGKFKYEAARLVDVLDPTDWEVIRK